MSTSVLVLEDLELDSWLLHSTCQTVLGSDTEIMNVCDQLRLLTVECLLAGMAAFPPYLSPILDRPDHLSFGLSASCLYLPGIVM